MTEDNGDPADGFYRFVPKDKYDLSQGGALQMLAIRGKPQCVTYESQQVGVEYQTEWVDIANPDPENAEDDPGAVFRQGLTLGGAQFMGLEGLALQDGVAYFVASEAGDAEEGQVWSFTPDGDSGLLKLLYESRDESELKTPVGEIRAGCFLSRRRWRTTLRRSWSAFLRSRHRFWGRHWRHRTCTRSADGHAVDQHREGVRS